MRRMTLVLLVLLTGCGGSAAPTGRPTPTPAPGVPVPRSGDDWPFTIARGWVACDTEATTGRPWVYLVADDEMQTWYGLNGAARDAGFPDGLDILGPGRIPLDVQPYIDLGLTLCD